MSFKKITFLKVLTVIAWADGEITQSELNVLHSFYRKFGLSSEETRELKPYLHAPIPKEDQEELFRQLTAELKSPREKKEFRHALEMMAKADEETHREEQALLERLSFLLEETFIAKKSLERIRNLLVRTIFKPAREKNPEMEKYFKNIVLKKIELKAAESGQKINLPQDKVYLICLFGTLLASVAFVDEDFSAEEKSALKRVLGERYSFAAGELEILSRVVEEQAKGGFDFHEVVTEFNRLVSYNDRVKLMDCFFEISAADKEMSHEEVEEIRHITKAMRIPHNRFIESKVKYLSKLR